MEANYIFFRIKKAQLTLYVVILLQYYTKIMAAGNNWHLCPCRKYKMIEKVIFEQWSMKHLSIATIECPNNVVGAMNALILF